MSSPTLPRALRLLRTALILALLTIGLFAALEAAVRWITPQGTRTVYEGTGSRGLKDSLLGHVNRPGASVTSRGPEFEVEYTINRDGLRDRTRHPSPKPAGSVRVLVLGDSFAFGEGNEYEKIWPVLVERQLRQRGHRIDVVKAGVPAYDTRKEALYLERLFPRYEPDIVLLTFLPNDLFANSPIEEDGAPDDPAIRARAGRPFLLHTVLLAKRLLMAIDYLYARVYTITYRRQYFSDPPGERLTEQLAVTNALLGRIARYCEERSALLAVLSIPQQFQVIAKANGFHFAGIDPDLPDRHFSQFAEGAGLVWIPTLEPLTRAYRANGEALYFRVDGHLNNAGNDIVAEVAVDAIERLLTAESRPVPPE